MKTLIVLILLVAVAASASENAKRTINEINEVCADKWPKNYRMQKHCRKQQTAALNGFLDLYSKYPKGSEEQTIMGRCMGEWTENELINWRMAMHCSKKQLEAYHSL